MPDRTLIKQAARLCATAAATEILDSHETHAEAELKIMCYEKSLAQVPLFQEYFPAGITAEHVTKELNNHSQSVWGWFADVKRECTTTLLPRYHKMVDPKTLRAYEWPAVA